MYNDDLIPKGTKCNRKKLHGRVFAGNLRKNKISLVNFSDIRVEPI